MRAVVQRVSWACVSAEGRELSRIDAGLLVYLGIGREDQERDVEYLADKIANLRVFEKDGQMAESILDTKADVLVVSQFTLYGDVRRGRRPDFLGAMRPEAAEALYERFLSALAMTGVFVRSGTFGAKMLVESANDGPVTILLDSQKVF